MRTRIAGGALGLALALVPAAAQQAADDWGLVPPHLGALVVIVGAGLAENTLVVSDADGTLHETRLGERGRTALQYRVEPGHYSIHLEGGEPFDWVAGADDAMFLWIGTEPELPLQAVRDVREGLIDAPEPMRVAPAGNRLTFTVAR